MAARAASPGAGGVFICASPVKAYDTDENQVLVAALHAPLPRRHGRRAPARGGQPHPRRRRTCAGPATTARRSGGPSSTGRCRRSVRVRPTAACCRRRAPAPRPACSAPPSRCSSGPGPRSAPTTSTPFLDDRTRTEHDLAADVARRPRTSAADSTDRLRIVDGCPGRRPLRLPAPRQPAPSPRPRRHRPASIVDGRPVNKITESRSALSRLGQAYRGRWRPPAAGQSPRRRW